MDGALDPERLRKGRETGLLSRYVRGLRLSAAELSEIQHLLPRDEGSDVAIPAPLPTAVGRYKKPLQDYVPVFKRHLRVIKGWIAVGKLAIEKGLPNAALPPLDDPSLFPRWWETHKTQRCPADLLALAVELEEKPPASTAAPGEPTTAAVDVNELDVEQLDSLRQAKRYLLALDRKLSAAYATGNQMGIKIWQKPFNDAAESVRKLEASQRESVKASGAVIPKAELFTDLSQLLELQRQMRSTMRRRICSRLSDLEPELLTRIGDVVDAAREGEDSVLRQLAQFRSIEEVHFQLEAQPAAAA